MRSLAWLCAALALTGAPACKQERARPAPAEPPGPPPPSVADVEAAARVVCTRLLECAGATPEVAAAQMQPCIDSSLRLATDGETRAMLLRATQTVIDTCGAVPCAEYPDCYMNALKSAEAALLGGAPASKELSPEFKRRFIALVCQGARENAGRVPDINAPNASPALRELKQMIAEAGSAGNVAELMKEAMRTCAGEPSQPGQPGQPQ